MRQAMAGMLWSKQFFYFDGDNWLDEHRVQPSRYRYHERQELRLVPHVQPGRHLHARQVGVPLVRGLGPGFPHAAARVVDPDFAKQQMRSDAPRRYLHPNGQIPAYEWNFSDVNPPVHAWATLFLHRTEQPSRRGDIDFLKAFRKLVLNFTWWVNRKDRYGKNVFEGGFLGLDNIGVFDRSSPLPTGGHLEQADGTAWMALFCQNMLEIAAELAAQDPATRTWRSSSSNTSTRSPRG